MTRPRLVIAGTASGVGKTTVALGVMGALAKRGLAVQGFKVGPDYIDGTYHAAVTGRPRRNLDPWMMGERAVPAAFAAGMGASRLGVIEGVMGLFDGVGPASQAGSTAHVATLLKAPVVLVIDASAMARSAGALVQGFARFDPAVRVAGVICNGVGSPAHYAWVRRAIERTAHVPVLGYLLRQALMTLPERHLGLVPAVEDPVFLRSINAIIAQVEQTVNLRRLVRIASSAGPLPEGGGPVPGGGLPAGDRGVRERVRVAIAQDPAFHFYYTENLELMERLGVDWAPFSPLYGERLPTGIQALYVGGGFPEMFVKPLARNQAMKTDIRRAVERGLPAYAECGGLMYFTRAIRGRDGRRWPMVGVVPGEIRMTDRLQRFGYQAVKALRPSFMFRPGETARGHEFHHSTWVGAPRRSLAYQLVPAVRSSFITRRSSREQEGFIRNNVVASYVHLHWGSQPRWAARFVEAARRCPPTPFAE